MEIINKISDLRDELAEKIFSSEELIKIACDLGINELMEEMYDRIEELKQATTLK